MTKHGYWEECIAIAAEECGVVLTPEQLTYIADAVEGGSENIGQAFYAPPNPLRGELDDLRRELKAERAKVICDECKGAGYIVTYGPYHSSESTCTSCSGEGRR